MIIAYHIYYMLALIALNGESFGGHLVMSVLNIQR